MIKEAHIHRHWRVLLSACVTSAFFLSVASAGRAATPLPAQYDCFMKSDGVTPTCAMPPADTPACSGTASVEDCFIWEPKVTNDPGKPPPAGGFEGYNVVFASGDLVTLYANGCAQGGGSGQTWHRYVNPHDNLHWGEAYIPGDLNPTRFTSPAGPSQIPISNTSNLQLRYNDDPGAYGDNGYWGWDGGDVNECLQNNGRNETTNDQYGGPAYVFVVIQHDTGSPSINITSPGPSGSYALGSAVPARFTCGPSVAWIAVTGCSAVGNGSSGSVDTSSVGTKTMTVQATDAAGRSSTASVSYTVFDPNAPTIQISAPAQGAVFDQGQVVRASYGCQDDPGGPGIASCSGDVPTGAPIDTSTVGTKTFTVRARDNAGLQVTKSASYRVVDVSPPAVSIAAPGDGGVYGRGQTVASNFACTDEAGGSGLASCTGTTGEGQPIDTATLGSKTFSVVAVDNAGNVTTKTVHYKVADVTPPSIRITTPSDGQVFGRGQRVLASYQCADEAGGSGIAKCVGAIASGAALDTSTPGTKHLTVIATDAAGNQATETVTYYVKQYPELHATATLIWANEPHEVIRITSLSGDNLQPRSTIEITCRGRGCRHRVRPVRVAKGRAHLTLRAMTGVRLHPGAVVRVEITKPRTIGRLWVFRVAHGWQVNASHLCVLPGHAPTACTS